MTTTAPEAVAELRVPPHSVEAEQSVLGAMLMDNRVFDRVADTLSANDFYRHEHRVIFEAIGSLVMAHKPADVVTVFERLQRDGKAEEVGRLAYLNSLAMSVPSVSSARRYAEIIRERAMCRSLIALGDQLATMGFAGGDVEESLHQAGEMFAALTQRQVKEAPKPLSDLLISAIDRYTAQADGTAEPAIPTGITPLDRVLAGGLRAKKVYGIAARPSVGKSSLARAIGLHVARRVPVLLLSQEMSGDEVADCTVSALGGIDSDSLQTGNLTGDDWGRMTEAVEEGSRLPFYVDDQGSLTLGDIRAKVRLVKGCGCVILDYLQLSRSTLKNANRNDQVGEISRGLKALAMALGIPVIVLSQLNRDVEKRADKEPQLSDLRDSGEIEQDLDVAALLWTAAEYDEGARRIVGCKVAKNRGGKKGRFALEFQASRYRWHESMASLDGPTRTEQRARGFE